MSSVRLPSYEKLEVIYFGIQVLIMEHFFQQVRLDFSAEVVALDVHQFMKDSGFLHFLGAIMLITALLQKFYHIPRTVFINFNNIFIGEFF